MIPTTFHTALAAQFQTEGFAVLPGFYGPVEVAAMLQCLESAPAGGAMLMRPLLLHALHRSTGEQPRRVVHLECAAVNLPAPLQWRERMKMTRLSGV